MLELVYGIMHLTEWHPVNHKLDLKLIKFNTNKEGFYNMLHPEPSLLALQYTVMHVQLVDCNSNYSLEPLVVNLYYTL